jgi:hypothetical protein
MPLADRYDTDTPFQLILEQPPMHIRFISTLTADDESRFAPTVLAILGRLLDEFPIPYTLRIETSDFKVFQRCHSALEIGPEKDLGVQGDWRAPSDGAPVAGARAFGE